MADSFVPITTQTTGGDQCPRGSYFIPAVQQCLDLNGFMQVYRQAQAAGNTQLVDTLWSQANPGGINVYGVLGQAGNNAGDLINQAVTGVSIDLLKVGVIVVGVVLVVIALASWLGLNNVQIAGVKAPLPKLK